MSSSGEAGIRTLGPLAETPVFKTGAIGRSATSPERVLWHVWRVSASCPEGLNGGEIVPKFVRRAGRIFRSMRLPRFELQSPALCIHFIRIPCPVFENLFVR